MTSLTDVLGLAAGILTTVSFVPQVWRIWKTKSANDISWGMFIIFALGNVMWFIYGLSLSALPILASSGVTLLLACAILVMKYQYAKAQ